MRGRPKSQSLSLELELDVCVALQKVLFWKVNVTLVGSKCRSISIAGNWIKFYLYDEQEWNLDEVLFTFLHEKT